MEEHLKEGSKGQQRGQETSEGGGEATEGGFQV